MKKGSKKNGWIKPLCIGAVCLVVGGGLTFGGIKLVQHLNEKDDTEVVETVDEEKQETDQSTELEIANAICANL